MNENRPQLPKKVTIGDDSWLDQANEWVDRKLDLAHSEWNPANWETEDLIWLALAFPLIPMGMIISTFNSLTDSVRMKINPPQPSGSTEVSMD